MHICAYTLPQRSSSHTTGRYHLHVCAACREFPPVLAPETRPTRASSSGKHAGSRVWKTDSSVRLPVPLVRSTRCC